MATPLPRVEELAEGLITRANNGETDLMMSSWLEQQISGYDSDARNSLRQTLESLLQADLRWGRRTFPAAIPRPRSIASVRAAAAAANTNNSPPNSGANTPSGSTGTVPTANELLAIISNLSQEDKNVLRGILGPEASTAGNTNARPTESGKEAKVPDPELFSGETSSDYDRWKRNMEYKLHVNGYRLPMPTRYIYSRTTGTAAGVCALWLDANKDKENDVEGLWRFLDEQFVDRTKQETARNKLSVAKQTGSIPDWINDVTRLAMEAKVSTNDLYLRDVLLKGLKTSVKKAAHPPSGGWQSLDFTNACRVLMDFHVSNQVLYSHDSGTGTPAASSAPKARANPDAMDWTPTPRSYQANKPGRSSSSRPTRSSHGPSTAERNRRREKNLCYECGQEGHIARRCPARQAKAAGAAPEDATESYVANTISEDCDGASEKE